MTVNRRLSSIQKILSVEKHPNADSLDIVKVLGWTCVAKAGEFQPGQLCVYMEVDSVLPPRPEFEFLKDKNYRIKTVRLRGQISQGICFPISILGYTIAQDALEGEDVKVNGNWIDVFKQPVTDRVKVSKKGQQDHEGLRTVYENGHLLVDETLETIRSRG